MSPSTCILYRRQTCRHGYMYPLVSAIRTLLRICIRLHAEGYKLLVRDTCVRLQSTCIWCSPDLIYTATTFYPFICRSVPSIKVIQGDATVPANYETTKSALEVKSVVPVVSRRLVLQVTAQTYHAAYPRPAYSTHKLVMRQLC